MSFWTSARSCGTSGVPPVKNGGTGHHVTGLKEPSKRKRSWTGPMDRLFFIAGCARSGTTLLLELMPWFKDMNALVGAERHFSHFSQMNATDGHVLLKPRDRQSSGLSQTAQGPACQRGQASLQGEAAEASLVSGTHKRNTAPMLAAPRCGAKTRSGALCRAPSVNAKKPCRMHGGARGTGAPKGNHNALKHGGFTREALHQRTHMGRLIRDAKKLLQEWKTSGR
jgi:hypothetical protein